MLQGCGKGRFWIWRSGKGVARGRTIVGKCLRCGGEGEGPVTRRQTLAGQDEALWPACVSVCGHLSCDSLLLRLCGYVTVGVYSSVSFGCDRLGCVGLCGCVCAACAVLCLWRNMSAFVWYLAVWFFLCLCIFVMLPSLCDYDFVLNYQSVCVCGCEIIKTQYYFFRLRIDVKESMNIYVYCLIFFLRCLLSLILFQSSCFLLNSVVSCKS